MALALLSRDFGAIATARCLFGAGSIVIWDDGGVASADDGVSPGMTRMSRVRKFELGGWSTPQATQRWTPW